MKSNTAYSVKSKALAFGEIERFTLGEIKSVLKPDEVGFHPPEVNFTAKRFQPSVRTDLVEKTSLFARFFLELIVGLEPTTC